MTVWRDGAADEAGPERRVDAVRSALAAFGDMHHTAFDPSPDPAAPLAWSSEARAAGKPGGTGAVLQVSLVDQWDGQGSLVFANNLVHRTIPGHPIFDGAVGVWIEFLSPALVPAGPWPRIEVENNLFSDCPAWFRIYSNVGGILWGAYLPNLDGVAQFVALPPAALSDFQPLGPEAIDDWVGVPNPDPAGGATLEPTADILAVPRALPADIGAVEGTPAPPPGPPMARAGRRR